MSGHDAINAWLRNRGRVPDADAELLADQETHLVAGENERRARGTTPKPNEAMNRALRQITGRETT